VGILREHTIVCGNQTSQSKGRARKPLSNGWSADEDHRGFKNWSAPRVRDIIMMMTPQSTLSLSDNQPPRPSSFFAKKESHCLNLSMQSNHYQERQNNHKKIILPDHGYAANKNNEYGISEDNKILR
jgi:hypothetical protein